jgi:hypothetical protein
VLTFPFRAPPQASTWYVKFIERGTAATASGGVLGIGNSTNAALFVFSAGVSTGYRVLHRRGADVFATASAVPNAGDTVELRAVLSASGTVLLGQSVNGAAEVVTAASGANALASAWSDTILTVNSRGPGSEGIGDFMSVRIAAGTQTLVTMRAA